LARYHTALDLIDELETLAGLLRLDAQEHVAILAAAAGLLGELVLLLDALADRFAVGHLRLADIRLDAELALHAVDDDVQVQLAHAGDDRLAGFLVGPHAEGRVLLRQA